MFKSEACVRRGCKWCMFMSQPVYGTIVNYRIGIRTQMSKWCLIQIIGENSVSRAGQLVGRKMILKFGKNSFIGKIMSLHGRERRRHSKIPQRSSRGRNWGKSRTNRLALCHSVPAQFSLSEKCDFVMSSGQSDVQLPNLTTDS